MPIQVQGYAARSADSPLTPFAFERRSPRPDDIVIDIDYCGVCHSDLHQARNDWGGARYPLVPGHEIVGRVTAKGPEVTRFELGEVVAIGCMVDSCRTCACCTDGLEQYCENGFTQTYNGIDRFDQRVTYGGYSQTIVCTQDFVLKVPSNLDVKAVAPLLCAGITTWSPLMRWGVKHGSRVGVVGLGGLGHMALKLAHALGAQVSLFTRSPGKAEDARRLGANHVVLSSDPKQMKTMRKSLDLIIDTVPYAHDIKPYISTLALDGTLVFVGLLGELSSTIDTSKLVEERRAIAGSLIGGIPETQQLLDFCGKHNIVAEVEMIAMHDINTAFDRMLKSDVKYRFVIDMKSLQSP